jgi:hypothetical protein
MGKAIFIHSSESFPCFLNGSRIQKVVTLNHGDVIATNECSFKFKQYLASNSGSFILFTYCVVVSKFPFLILTVKKYSTFICQKGNENNNNNQSQDVFQLAQSQVRCTLLATQTKTRSFKLGKPMNFSDSLLFQKDRIVVSRLPINTTIGKRKMKMI